MATATKKRPKTVAKNQYVWRGGSRFPVTAQVAGEELDRIEAENGGNVAPRDVVAASEPEEAPLHPVFEWDDERAAELYRDEQARNVIRSVRVVRAEDGEEAAPVIRYVHVTLAETGSTYVTTARALSDEDLRQQVLSEALAQLRGFRSRYQQLSELNGVFAAVDAVLEHIEEAG